MQKIKTIYGEEFSFNEKEKGFLVTVNNYRIRFNSLFKEYVVSHDEIGAGIASFKNLQEAKEYCLNG